MYAIHTYTKLCKELSYAVGEYFLTLIILCSTIDTWFFRTAWCRTLPEWWRRRTTGWSLGRILMCSRTSGWTNPAAWRDKTAWYVNTINELSQLFWMYCAVHISWRADVFFFRLAHTENGHLCPFLCPFFEVPPPTDMHITILGYYHFIFFESFSS